MTCYPCRTALTRSTLRGRLFWQCRKCKGTLFPDATLEAIAEGKAVLVFVRQKPNNVLKSKRGCPVCGKLMRLAYSGGGTDELDTCDRCRLVWFDGPEFEEETPKRARFGSPRPRAVAPPNLHVAPASPAVAEDLLSAEDLSPETAIFAFARLPFEEGVPEPKAWYWAVPTLLFFCVLLSLNVDRSSELFGFVPANPGKLWGLAWLTSAFVHGDLPHLLSNAYFLWLYGKSVESRIGGPFFLELFGLSILGGHLLVFLLGPQQAMYLGASGGVTGLGVFYALSFPRARFSYFFPYFSYFSETWFSALRLRVPAALALAFFLALDVLGANRQITGEALGVSHLSHLGGAAVGFVYWLLSSSSSGSPGTR